jgi:hypothetical protein
MYGDQHRYFIELQPDEGEPVPRWREAANRREIAARFIETVIEWLKEEELGDKVSAIAITALGQVLITCETNVINQMRHQDLMNIAAIRQGVMYVEQAKPWNEAR